ncbi:MAG: pilus assembly protein [Gemmataceae bacterium]|nr:pilus assembly protein [Gemmataceae bacterium]
MIRESNWGRSARSGAAVVELAVLLPLLVFLLVVAVDYARIFHYSVTITNCARNGALYGRDPVAAAESPFTSIQQAALAEAPNLKPEPTVTSVNGTDAAGQPYVEVTVSYNFQTLTRYPGIPDTINLSRTVRMHVAAAVPSN